MALPVSHALFLWFDVYPLVSGGSFFCISWYFSWKSKSNPEEKESFLVSKRKVWGWLVRLLEAWCVRYGSNVNISSEILPPNHVDESGSVRHGFVQLKSIHSHQNLENPNSFEIYSWKVHFLMLFSIVVWFVFFTMKSMNRLKRGKQSMKVHLPLIKQTNRKLLNQHTSV